MSCKIYSMLKKLHRNTELYRCFPMLFKHVKMMYEMCSADYLTIQYSTFYI